MGRHKLLEYIVPAILQFVCQRSLDSFVCKKCDNGRQFGQPKRKFGEVARGGEGEGDLTYTDEISIL